MCGGGGDWLAGMMRSPYWSLPAGRRYCYCVVLPCISSWLVKRLDSPLCSCCLVFVLIDRPDGQKKAYVRLTADYDALDVANRIGVI